MQIARDAGVGRESLYEALSPGAHPGFETVTAVLKAIGVKFAVVATKGTQVWELVGRARDVGVPGMELQPAARAIG